MSALGAPPRHRACWPPCRHVGHDRGGGTGSNVSRITAKEHALGPHTRPRKSRNGAARTYAKARAREAIAEVLPAAAHRTRVRDPGAARTRHDAEDDRG